MLFSAQSTMLQLISYGVPQVTNHPIHHLH